MKKHQESLSDRVVSAVSYLTVGWGGLLYLIIMALRRANLTRFVRYNITQSIFMSLLYFILAFLIGMLLNLLSYIPGINILISNIVLFFSKELLFNYSIIQTFVIGVILYATVTSAVGNYPKIYWVSDIINRQIR